MLMAAPPRKKTARLENRTFISVPPKPGLLLLWESWLRHGVEPQCRKTSPHLHQLQLRLSPPDAHARLCYDFVITMGGRS